MEQHLLSSFLVIGVNYKKSNSIIRSQFALTKVQIKTLLNQAKVAGVPALFVVSTCNRTELYTYQPYYKTVVGLLAHLTHNSVEDFQAHAFKKTAIHAVEHLLEVSTGLDSQILGDYEIVGQIKQAYAMAKEAGTVDTFLDRHISIALQCSKKVKTETRISSGTTSVAFAAIQFLKGHFSSLHHKKIVLVGTGKIGGHTCKNLLDYTDAASITLINRTEAKAVIMANELDVATLPFEQLSQGLSGADIIIVSTAGINPLITADLLPAHKEQLLIDLSIPNNIHPHCGTMPDKKLVSVDDLASINDATLEARQQEVPLARTIIKEHLEQFEEWLQVRKHAPFISATRNRLINMGQCDMFKTYTLATPLLFVQHPMEQKMQKAIRHLAKNIKEQNKGGCNVIEAINHFMTPTAN